MSCEDCEKEQATLEKQYYFRIGNGNILVFGCEKHIKMLQDKLRS
jgi:hypothetical protein